MSWFTLWILITLLPASFFTWGNASRYLYLPAAGFALLLAEAVKTIHRLCLRVVGPRTSAVITGFLVAFLTTRFVVFARKEAAIFRARTAPYARFVAEVRRASPLPPPDGIVHVDRQTIQLVPEAVRDQAASLAYCVAPAHVVER